MAAFEKLSAPLVAVPAPAAPALPPPPETQLSYKSQLEIYAAKRGRLPPSYRAIHGGSLHVPLFKSEVTIDGKKFESPKYCRTLKEAETAAAEVALISVPQEASPTQHLWLPSVPYKNLLQELIQKKGFPLPIYATTSDVNSGFRSTVEVQGATFRGEPRNTKKQAEMNAAEVAFQHFKDKDKVKGSACPTVQGGSSMQAVNENLSAGQNLKTLAHVVSTPSGKHGKHGRDNDSGADFKRVKVEEVEEMQHIPGPSTSSSDWAPNQYWVAGSRPNSNNNYKVAGLPLRKIRADLCDLCEEI